MPYILEMRIHSFFLKDDDHKLNGEIKKTGIYLRESSGEVGTVNHVDLIV